MKKAGLLFLVMIVIAVVAAGIGYWKLTGEESDTLRKIVLEQCLPNQQENQNPSPCAEVKPNAGYVVLKDRHGPLQYLLMPTYRINGTESPLPGGLRGHEYLARRVTESELVQRSPFMMLAEEVPEAREHMGSYGLAMVRQSDNSFVLLATQRNLLTLNRASAEEIQDHQCEILR